MPTNGKKLIALSTAVTIEAAQADGEKKSAPKFTAEFYTGGALEIDGWDLPVVVDLAGLKNGNVLVANLDHDRTKRVGNFAVANDGKSLVANGTANARTAARDEVVGSAEEGYQWQASLEVTPHRIETIKAGKTVEVNGQTLTGPLYVTREGTLKGFAFVSHGADDNTHASIAAIAASHKENTMKAEVREWVQAMLPSIDIDSLSEAEIANLEANYNGKPGTKKVTAAARNPFEERKLEAKRRAEIREVSDKLIEARNSDYTEIEAIEKLNDHAIESGMSSLEYRVSLQEAMLPYGVTVSMRAPQSNKVTARVLQAALCSAGMLRDVESHFTDQELQTAHDLYPQGISLNEFLIEAAKVNGYNGSTSRVNLDVQRAAFRQNAPNRPIHAAGGFSTIDVSSIVAATANKFLHEGWMAVDMTPLRIASVRSVRNFQQITTVSLTGHLQFDKLGADGEIKHGTLDNLTYTNQVDTYARMLAITRQDIINDDLGALTAAPRRLGRGGALKLNDIFWTEFLSGVSTSFFSVGNSNINTGVADMTLGGLTATETIFVNQTDPDGKPLALAPKILLVPPALRASAVALMDPQSQMTGGTSNVSTANPFRARFTVESSPYISNSSYTGYTSAGWWMLADPNDMAVIEIAALNGKIEPTVETADADFNVLGIQMRGYSDIGVNFQEYRAGVYADGGSS